MIIIIVKWWSCQIFQNNQKCRKKMKYSNVSHYMLCVYIYIEGECVYVDWDGQTEKKLWREWCTSDRINKQNKTKMMMKIFKQTQPVFFCLTTTTTITRLWQDVFISKLEKKSEKLGLVYLTTAFWIMVSILFYFICAHKHHHHHHRHHMIGWIHLRKITKI